MHCYAHNALLLFGHKQLHAAAPTDRDFLCYHVDWDAPGLGHQPWHDHGLAMVATCPAETLGFAVNVIL